MQANAAGFADADVTRRLEPPRPTGACPSIRGGRIAHKASWYGRCKQEERQHTRTGHRHPEGHAIQTDEAHVKPMEHNSTQRVHPQSQYSLLPDNSRRYGRRHSSQSMDKPRRGKGRPESGRMNECTPAAREPNRRQASCRFGSLRLTLGRKRHQQQPPGKRPRVLESSYAFSSSGLQK